MSMRTSFTRISRAGPVSQSNGPMLATANIVKSTTIRNTTPAPTAHRTA
jgi:hypothetical protein